MRVFLIVPIPPRDIFPRGLFRSRWAPSGVSQIAAELLRTGHEVKIHVREEHMMKLDLDHDAMDRQLFDELDAFHPDLVGFSVVTPAMPETITLSEEIRRRLGDDVLLLAGGIHPTVMPERTLEEAPALDAVAIGEGEDTLCEIADRGLKRDVAGLILRDGDGFFHTPPRQRREDLDSFSPIPYDRLYDMTHYSESDPWRIRWLHLRSLNLRTSRGCTNRCRFCAGHLLAGIGIRLHSPDYVIDQIERTIDTYSLDAVLFEDETLGADTERLVEICRRIRNRGWEKRIKWTGCLRVDQAEPELLTEMQRSGCIQIEYGFESGSARMLKKLGKGADVEQNERAIRMTREHGIRVFANIMIGLPDETEEDLDETIAFIRRTRPDVISPTQLSPLPGTPIYNALPLEVRDSLDWGGYTYMDHRRFELNLTAMSDEVYYRRCQSFFKYLANPMIHWQVLRDAPADDTAFRRRFLAHLRRLSWRHPIHFVRLPRSPKNLLRKAS